MVKSRLRSSEYLSDVWLTIIICLVLFPVIWLILISFRSQVDMFQMPPNLATGWTFANYAELFKNGFGRYLWNSIVVAIGATFIALVVGIPAAYGLARGQQLHDQIMSYWLLFVRMALPMSFAIPFFLMMRRVGLIDTKLGLILVHVTFDLPFVVWTMRPHFESIPIALEEAAYVDGAHPRDVFLKVILPISTPGIVVTAIFAFLLSWNDFFFAFILTRRLAQTAPVTIANFMSYEGYNWGGICSAGVLVMMPVLVFSLVVRRYLIQGLMSGAFKG